MCGVLGGSVLTLRNIPYTLTVGPIENAYCDNHLYWKFSRLVLLRRASLPDVCVVCGSPARGNVLHKEFEQRGLLSHLPSLLYVVYLIFGKRYLLDFPFCPTCEPDNFQLIPLRIDDSFAIFENASRTLLKFLFQIRTERSRVCPNPKHQAYPFHRECPAISSRAHPGSTRKKYTSARRR